MAYPPPGAATATRWHPVVWAQTVTEFLALPEWGGPIALVVLDHDLDLAHGGEPKVNVGPGPDGLTGMDAVERMPAVSCPVLVWSVNEGQAPIMVQVLERRGMVPYRAPFSDRLWCAGAIHSVLA